MRNGDLASIGKILALAGFFSVMFGVFSIRCWFGRPVWRHTPTKQWARLHN